MINAPGVCELEASLSSVSSQTTLKFWSEYNTSTIRGGAKFQHRRMWLILLAVLSTVHTTVIAESKCSVDTQARSPKYHLMEKCYRSKLGMVSKANFTSLTSCQRLGIEKKGLAINFSPPEAWDDSNETLEFTCEVLKCAEVDGGLSMVDDSRYDYYSIYAKPIRK